MLVKTCKKCGGTEYYAKGGCATCMKATSAKRRAERHEETIAATAAWRAKNKERIFSYNAAYREANKERTSEYMAEYRIRTLAATKKRLAQWRANNPDYWRSHEQNRRARENKTGGKLSKGISDKLMKLQKGKCACCRESVVESFHLDHIVPLARSGENSDSNMQLLCPACNLSKHAKDPIKFMQSRGFLI